MADVRRASDTRPLPAEPAAAGAPAPAPTPGRQRLDTIKRVLDTAEERGDLISSLRVDPPSYPPAKVPGGAPVLTREQASQLIDGPGFPSRYEKYRKLFVDALVDRSQALPVSQRRAFSVLLRLSKHECMKETMHGRDGGVYTILTPSIEEGEQNFEGDELTEFLKTKFQGLANYFVDGFDVVDSTHFIYNKFGRIVGVNKTNFGRKKDCDAQIKADLVEKSKRSWKPGATELGYDGGNKTRKHKRRSKKTLRRRKVRRNVH
jgi:hypothetical protein